MNNDYGDYELDSNYSLGFNDTYLYNDTMYYEFSNNTIY